MIRGRVRDVRLLDAAVLALAIWQQIQIWTVAGSGAWAAVVPLQLVFVVALLLRDRHVAASRMAAFAALGVWAGFMPHDHGSSASFFVGSMLAFWVAGFTSDIRAAVAGWSAGLLLVAYAESVFPDGGFGEFLFTAVIQTGVWTAALVLASRTRQARLLEADLASAQAEREERARRSVAAERSRIARELHDVVSHNLTVAIIQLTAAHGGPADAETTEEPERHLEAAEASCRLALAEMRRLLGVLRVDGEEPARVPAPGLAALDDLVAAVRAAGLPLELTVEGSPYRPPDGVDLAAYRIVQEALTNALKHSGRAETSLTLRYRGDAIEIEVVDAGPRRSETADASGRGLIGMRERASVYGGRLDAGPRAEGGFRVLATLRTEPGAI